MGPRPEVFAKKGPEAGKYSQKKIRSQLGILHNTGRFIEQSLALLIGTNRSAIRLDDGVITSHLGAMLSKCRRDAVKM